MADPILVTPLSSGMGRAVLDHLRQLTPLPDRGVIAGQAVASALLHLYGRSGFHGPINDIDVFDLSSTSKRALRMSFEPTSRIVMSKGRSKVGSDEDPLYFQPRTPVSAYKITEILRDGLVNTVRMDPAGKNRCHPLNVIAPFDLNMVQVGVDIRNGALHWSKDFQEFCRTGDLKISSFQSEVHTLIRAAKKIREMPWLECDIGLIRDMTTLSLHIRERSVINLPVRAGKRAYEFDGPLTIGDLYLRRLRSTPEHEDLFALKEEQAPSSGKSGIYRVAPSLGLESISTNRLEPIVRMMDRLQEPSDFRKVSSTLLHAVPAIASGQRKIRMEGSGRSFFTQKSVPARLDHVDHDVLWRQKLESLTSALMIRMAEVNGSDVASRTAAASDVVSTLSDEDLAHLAGHVIDRGRFGPPALDPLSDPFMFLNADPVRQVCDLVSSRRGDETVRVERFMDWLGRDDQGRFSSWGGSESSGHGSDPEGQEERFDQEIRASVLKSAARLGHRELCFDLIDRAEWAARHGKEIALIALRAREIDLCIDISARDIGAFTDEDRFEMLLCVCEQTDPHMVRRVAQTVGPTGSKISIVGGIVSKRTILGELIRTGNHIGFDQIAELIVHSGRLQDDELPRLLAVAIEHRKTDFIERVVNLVNQIGSPKRLLSEMTYPSDLSRYFGVSSPLAHAVRYGRSQECAALLEIIKSERRSANDQYGRPEAADLYSEMLVEALIAASELNSITGHERKAFQKLFGSNATPEQATLELTKVCRLLLDSWADPTRVVMGTTASHQVILTDNVPLCQLVMSKGGSASCVDEFGLTPMRLIESLMKPIPDKSSQTTYKNLSNIQALYRSAQARDAIHKVFEQSIQMDVEHTARKRASF